MIFQENRTCMTSLFFNKKQQSLKMSSSANYRWRFRGERHTQHPISEADNIKPSLALPFSKNLILKAPITTAADDKFCDIFPSFQ